MRWPVLVLPLLLLLPTAVGMTGGPDDTTLLLTVDEVPLSEDQRLILATHGVEVLDTFEVSRSLLVQAPAGSADRLIGQPFVQAIQPDRPMDRLLDSSRRAVGMTEELYDAGVTGQGVNVALLDSGIDQDHPALAERVIADIAFSEDGTSFDAPSSSEHGTHVAGILVGTGAASPSGQNLHGVAPGSGLVSLDLSQQFTTSNALRAFEWLYDNHETYDIRVVANSWGRQREDATYDPDDPIIRANDALVDEGLVVVFSSGNGGDKPGRMTLEATNPNAITVGAVDDSGDVESYSSRGPINDEDGQPASWTKPDLVAPGTRVVSTRDGGGTSNAYLMMNGTSMAAPHVAGAAALLLSIQPDLTPAQVKGLLTESARDVAAPGVDDESGSGMLDVRGAIALLEESKTRNVTHWEVVAEDQGSLTGPSQVGDVLQAASIDHRETMAFQVPTNATELEVEITWDGRSSMEATLREPGGKTQRQVPVQGQRTLTVEDPQPGRWTLTLESQGIGEGEYDAKAAVAWSETKSGTGLPVSALRTSQGGGFPMMPSSDPFGPSLIPGVPNLVPMLAGGALTLVLFAGKMTHRRGT